MRHLILFLLSFPCLAGTLNLKLNEWKKLDKDLQFRVTKILEDSRCPEGTQCEWAGMAIIEVEVVSLKETNRIKMTIARNNNGKYDDLKKIIKMKNENPIGGFTSQGYSVALMDVAPYPGSIGKVPADPSGFTFEILNKGK